MQVTVTLHATLKRYQPGGSISPSFGVDLPTGSTVADVIRHLGIPPGHAKMIVSGNDQLETTSVLRDGQAVDLFPPLAGGV
jgi:molybdopterin converting factor small subunit